MGSHTVNPTWDVIGLSMHVRRAPHVVQVQLGEVFKTIVYSDYPEKWPGLLQALCTNMVNQVCQILGAATRCFLSPRCWMATDILTFQPQDPLRVHGGLYALRILARKYEFRDESERAPMTELVNTALPVSNSAIEFGAKCVALCCSR